MNCFRCTTWPCTCRDGITLIHGDCREVLPQLPTIDAVVTDPPYGMNALDGTRVRRFGISRQSNWDSEPISDECISQVINAAPVCIMWGMNYLCNMMPRHKCFLIWNKPHLAHLPNRSAAEIAFTNLEMPAKAISMPADYKTQHPAQKPVALMKWCLSFIPNYYTILDPFMGSGTTLVAAKQLNRKAIGIEIEEKYCTIAANRLRQEVLTFGEAH